MKNKYEAIDFFINKLKDENYIKEEKSIKEIIDPVNDYIMNKKYKQKFRKSKTDIKKEKINKKELDKNKDKDKSINKNKKQDKKVLNKNKNTFNDIDIDNIEVEKEIINLDNNEEEKKETKDDNNKKILNKKTKRNKNDKSAKQKK